MRPVLYTSVLILILVSSIAVQPAYPKEEDFPPLDRKPVTIVVDFLNSKEAVPGLTPSLPEFLPINEENVKLLRRAMEDSERFYETIVLPELNSLIRKNASKIIGSDFFGFYVGYYVPGYEYLDESLTLEIRRSNMTSPGYPTSVTNPLPLDSMKKVIGNMQIIFTLDGTRITNENFGQIYPWVKNQTNVVRILTTKTIWTIGTFGEQLQETQLHRITMDMLDERASRITISYVKDGMEHQLTKYWIEQEPPYWVSNSLSINNIIGEPLQKFESGKTMMLTAKLNGNTGAGFVHLMQVKNADGVTEQLTWTISEPFDGSWQVSYSFIPSHSGEFTIESFVWRSTQGTPLGDVAEQTITVTR